MLIYKMSIGVAAVRLIIFVENPLLKKIFDEKPVFWASLDGGKIFLFQNFFSVLLIWYLATSKLLSVFFGHKKSTGLVVSPSTPVQILFNILWLSKKMPHHEKSAILNIFLIWKNLCAGNCPRILRILFSFRNSTCITPKTGIYCKKSGGFFEKCTWTRMRACARVLCCARSAQNSRFSTEGRKSTHFTHNMRTGLHGTNHCWFG